MATNKKNKQVNLKNKPKMRFNISSKKKRYKTYESQRKVTYRKNKKKYKERNINITQMMVGKQWVKR